MTDPTRLVELERARALPEIAAGDPSQPAPMEPGSIEAFMDDANGERRVMLVVLDANNTLSKQLRPETQE